ncbi:hypothetical protein AQUCO_08900027v1 [Aquilegia coerulea]|uniref:Uncharacterized protein n=1 Tax=Aquilegia coerulea TaxID=218851 RepID=A0A2G5C669_AQUCA|nr:hypothetical protein AQUCO_08900027v1 [Aquilegia coerulea]
MHEGYSSGHTSAMCPSHLHSWHSSCGTRYGASLRTQIKKMEVSQHSKYFCEFCGKDRGRGNPGQSPLRFHVLTLVVCGGGGPRERESRTIPTTVPCSHLSGLWRW